MLTNGHFLLLCWLRWHRIAHFELHEDDDVGEDEAGDGGGRPEVHVEDVHRPERRRVVES